MSSSLLLDQQLADNIPGAVPGMPREAILDVVPRSALQATKRIVNLVPISASSVTSNQTLQFLIPQRNLAKAHSFYLKYRVTLPTIAGNATKRFSFAGSMQSAASVINTISVQAGGTVIESCQNYHLWHNNVLSYTQRRDQLGFESPAAGAVASARTFTDAGYTATASISNDAITNPYDAVGVNNFTIGASGAFSEVFSIPIGMGFFNPKESQFVPLFQLNGGVLLTIQTNAVSKAFSAQTVNILKKGAANTDPPVSDSTAAVINDYTLSDFELCYTEIQPSQSYVDAVRGGLAAGKLIRIEAQSYLNYQIACGSAIRQTLNLNCQSLAASFWGRVEDLDSLATSKFFVKQNGVNDGDTGATAASAIRYEMYYDNVLLFNSPNQLNYDTVVLRQLQEALTSSITDHNVSPLFNRIGQNVGTFTSVPFPIGDAPAGSPPNIVNSKTYGSLASQQWLYGLSNKLFASNSTSMDGTPVGTVQIQFTTPGDVSTNLWYFFFVYDYMYMVDANGAVSKVM
jgi:hypothetical protein